MSIRISVVYAPVPRNVKEVHLTLADGSTVANALQASGLLVQFADLNPQGMLAGVWGRRTGLNQVLHDQDRVEIYRPLKVDPKVARRERFASQGAKTAGLFAKRRPGGKAGY